VSDHPDSRPRAETPAPQDQDDGGVPVDFAPATGRRLQRMALVVVVVLLLGFALVTVLRLRQRHALEDAAASEAAQRPTVLVTTAGSAGGRGSLNLPGETAAWFESTIYARVNGYVARWMADIGDQVRQGQLMAVIETPELDAQLDAARAQLNAAEAQVRVREAEAELAATTYARWRDSPKGVVSDQEREEKRADHDSAEARLNAARAQVVLNQAEVDHDLALTRFKNVTAPFDGVVVERRIDIGNLVTAGSTASTMPLYRISRDRPIRVFVEAPQSAAADLMQPGTRAEVRIGKLPGQSYAGPVTRTSQSIDPRARTLKVEVDLPNRDGRLVPGMYVDVGFQLHSSELVQVPAAAMIFRTGGPQIGVVGPDGHLHFHSVTIARDDGATLALASGVTAGDKVALNLSSQIGDGDLVVAQDSAPAAPQAAAAGDAHGR
jgi:RND family efflux transporter MFP subunit